MTRNRVLLTLLCFVTFFAPEFSIVANAASDAPISVACITTAPHLDVVTEDGQIVSLLLFALESLVTTEEDGQGGIRIVPGLAESWKVSEDGLSYTFNLKKGVKFHDGTPVTTEDWIWSILRLRDAGPESPWSYLAHAVKEVSAPDEDTLVISLSEPYAPFLSNLTNPALSVQSKKHFEKVGAEAFRDSPMGTGPYYFAEWELNQRYILKKNPYYHVEGKPVASEFRFIVVPDDNTRIMQLQAGQVDVVRDLPHNRIDELASYPGLAVDTEPSTEQRFVNFNVTFPPLDDVRVRNALRLATDKQAIIKMVLFGHGSPVFGVFPRVDTFYNKKLKDPGYDVAKARALLKDAGQEKGFKLEIIYSSGNSVMENIATVLKEQWAKVGVDLQLVPLEGPTVSASFQNLKHQVTMLRWSTDTADPVGFTSFIADYDASHGFHTGWKNERVTQLAHAAEKELDVEKRRGMYEEIQQILFDECPMYPLYENVYPVARKDTVHNFRFSGLSRYVFIDAYKDE